MWTPEPHWSVPVVFRSGLSGVEELDRPETVNPPQAPATKLEAQNSVDWYCICIKIHFAGELLE